MPDYAAQLTPEDRWAVVAYIRALQLSQRASQADVASGARVESLDNIAEREGSARRLRLRVESAANGRRRARRTTRTTTVPLAPAIRWQTAAAATCNPDSMASGHRIATVRDRQHSHFLRPTQPQPPEPCTSRRIPALRRQARRPAPARAMHHTFGKLPNRGETAWHRLNTSTEPARSARDAASWPARPSGEP